MMVVVDVFVSQPRTTVGRKSQGSYRPVSAIPSHIGRSRHTSPRHLMENRTDVEGGKSPVFDCIPRSRSHPRRVCCAGIQSPRAAVASTTNDGVADCHVRGEPRPPPPPPSLITTSTSDVCVWPIPSLTHYALLATRSRAIGMDSL